MTIRPITVLLLSTLLLASAASTAGAQSFDHRDFSALLARSVIDGRVDYEKIRRDGALGTYLDRLATARPEKMGTDDQLAFWINAYNACVIKGVIDNPGIKRPLDVKGFFDGRRYAIAGRRLTLDEIENRIIRPRFGEKLIHFGLVCAARSCPRLLPRAYDGATVRTDLTRNAAAFLASSQNRLENGGRTLALSKIFEWYGGDFGGERGVRVFVKAHGTAAMRAALDRDPEMPIAYLDYDWTLNGR